MEAFVADAAECDPADSIARLVVHALHHSRHATGMGKKAGNVRTDQEENIFFPHAEQDATFKTAR